MRIMALKEEFMNEVSKTLGSKWDIRDGQVIPESTDLALGNQAVKLQEAVVLYADMSDSTKLVDTKGWQFAAEIYKSFLYTSAKVIRSEGGEITAYDGDRVMAVYLGDYKNTSAARSALKINYCCINILNPLIKKYYPSIDYQFKHVVGIDVCQLHAARTGVRGANDLVWVGRAANYAAKLTTLSDSYPSRITGSVYDRLPDILKFTDGQSMWEQVKWTAMNDMRIYRSTWWWRID
jgi:class 3 adenylate cyclase